MYSMSNGGSLRIRMTSEVTKRDFLLGALNSPPARCGHPRTLEAVASDRCAVPETTFKSDWPEIVNLGVAAGGLEQHCERTVLVGRDGFDGIHDDANTQGMGWTF